MARATEVWIRLWTQLIFPAPSYPWPINFLRSSCFYWRKTVKLLRWYSHLYNRHKLFLWIPLTNHLPQMDSSSWALITWPSSAKRKNLWRPWSQYMLFLILIPIALSNTLALNLDVYCALDGPSPRCFSCNSSAFSICCSINSLYVVDCGIRFFAKKCMDLIHL